MRSVEALARFIRSREARQLAPKTIGFYHWCLDPFAGACPELPETPDEIEEYLCGLRCAAESQRDVWRALRALYRFGNQRWGVGNAMAAIPQPRKVRTLPRWLTEEEVRRLLAHPMTRRDRAMVALLLDTGMRLGELHNLTPCQTLSGTIRLSGKTGEREVPLSPAVRRALIGVELPWSGPKGVLTRNGIYLVIRRLMRGAGIARGGPHVLRHTFARSYVLSGGDVFSLQRILGHRSIETTRIYVELDTRDLIAQHAKYSRLLELAEKGVS